MRSFTFISKPILIHHKSAGLFTGNKGSVITIDCGVDILAQLNGHKTYFHTTDPLLIEQLEKCPIKQLPTYASKTLKHMGRHSTEVYRNILTHRLDDCEKESQRKKLEKLLRSIPDDSKSPVN